MGSLTNAFQQYETAYYITHHKTCKHNTQKKLVVQTEKIGLKTEIYTNIKLLERHFESLNVHQSLYFTKFGFNITICEGGFSIIGEIWGTPHIIQNLTNPPNRIPHQIFSSS